MRRTVDRYASALGRLDVPATRAVWPTIDASALRRAFDSLESQRVVFDRCDVDVGQAGATAACRGGLTYVPKVGDRTPTSRRLQWTFYLRKGRTDWAIEAVEIR